MFSFWNRMNQDESLSEHPNTSRAVEEADHISGESKEGEPKLQQSDVAVTQGSDDHSGLAARSPPTAEPPSSILTNEPGALTDSAPASKAINPNEAPAPYLPTLSVSSGLKEAEPEPSPSIQEVGANLNDTNKAVPKEGPDGDKKMHILSLVCEESMPVFSDKTIPFPVVKVVQSRGPSAKSAASRAKKAAGAKPNKKRAAESLTGSPEKRSAPGLGDTPVRANTAAARAQWEQPVAPEVAFLDEYGQYLTYDWSELKLGTVNGSAAWNRALREKLLKDPSMGSVPQVSPIDVLQWVHQLQAQSETIAPHPLSYLRQVVTKPKWENERNFKQKMEAREAYEREKAMEADSSAQTAPPSKEQSDVVPPSSDLPSKEAKPQVTSEKAVEKDVEAAAPARDPYEVFTTSVARAYQDCLLQDVTDYRPEYQCMRPAELVERMRQLENRAAGLQERGRKVKESAVWKQIVI